MYSTKKVTECLWYWICYHLLYHSAAHLPFQYPVPKLVELAAIDEQFTASRAHLHRAVDLQEDYMQALLHFKETCGRGAQALLKDCIEIVAVRAKGSRLSLCLDIVGEVSPLCISGRVLVRLQASVFHQLACAAHRLVHGLVPRPTLLIP